MSSSYHPVSDHQENLAMAEVYQPRPKPPKSQRSFSGHQLTSSSMPCTSSRQIDAEFRRLYHHFICRGTSSSCPTSSCHLCERHLELSVQSTPTCTSNMSALALTPVQRRLKKRRRQSEVEEEPVKLKRFRESCSPISHTHLWLKQQQQQQQSSEYMNTAVANPSEEGRTWNRALLLYCPSPEFLRARKGIRRVSESKPGLQMDLHSPSRIGPVEACQGDDFYMGLFSDKPSCPPPCLPLPILKYA
ncbi:hypothetical protein NFI96_005750 [Prochilodus magdalenae]|nr:hypothetical protein NFI96_005750 [Prochilodus magdalenae]